MCARADTHERIDGKRIRRDDRENVSFLYIIITKRALHCFPIFRHIKCFLVSSVIAFTPLRSHLAFCFPYFGSFIFVHTRVSECLPAQRPLSDVRARTHHPYDACVQEKETVSVDVLVGPYCQTFADVYVNVCKWCV